MHNWAFWPIVFATVITAVFAWFGSPRRIHNISIIKTTIVLVVCISLQLIPLSINTLNAISPATVRLLADTKLEFAAGLMTHHPLALIPQKTVSALVFLASLAMLFVALTCWLSRRRVRTVAVLVGAFSIALSIIGVVQQAISPRNPYGFWALTQGGEPFGPFINKNHFAGWVLMALPLCVGLFYGELATHRQSKNTLTRMVNEPVALLSIFACVVLGIALVMSLSRSGIVIAAFCIPVGFALAVRRVTQRWTPVPLIAAALFVLAATAVGWSAVTFRFGELDAHTFGVRLQIWRDTVEMIHDFPLFGVGLANYGQANLHYQTVLPQLHVASAHNDWLQLIAEGGLLVSIPAGLFVLAVARECASRLRRHFVGTDFGRTFWLRVGSVVGIIAICMQSLVEFSLQIPANTLMFAFLIVIATAPLDRAARIQRVA